MMRRFFWLILILGFAPGFSLAQPFTLDENIKPLRLDLKPLDHPKGSKGHALQGTTIVNSHYFYVKGHGMLQPLDIILEAPEESDLRLEVFHSTWKEPVMSASTGREGFSTLQFMAYGEFGIRIQGDSVGVPYLLTVYGSPETLPEFENPFVVDEKSSAAVAPSSVVATEEQKPVEKAEEGEGGTLIYIVIGLLVVIVGLLAALLLKKNRSGTGVLVLMTSAGVLLWPSPPAQAEPVDSSPSDYENQGAEGRGNAGQAYGDGNIRPMPGVFQQPPSQGGGEGLPTDPLASYWEGGTKTIEYLKQLQQGISAWEAYQSLDSCMRIASPPDMPLVPSFCAAPVGVVGAGTDGQREYRMNPDQSCSECFTDARVAFNKARLDLEKLRVIYSCTKKMSNAAIAAGDSMSGIHGYTGVIWQGMRHNLMQSVDKMEKAYDTKYPELIKKLHQSMIEMSICEAHYGTPDWYDRFGFVYYEFMSDAYKRKD